VTRAGTSRCVTARVTAVSTAATPRAAARPSETYIPRVADRLFCGRLFGGGGPQNVDDLPILDEMDQARGSDSSTMATP